MIIDCISDLHGHFPELPGGDLLIIAGDLTAGDKTGQYERFFTWLCTQDHYTKKILIAGNHDNGLLNTPPKKVENGIYHYLECCEYLCDSGTEFEGLKIWGSPWTKSFPNMNPKCKAFTVDTEEELAEKWALIPDDLDILITHCPPYGLLDTNAYGENCGSRSLGLRIAKIQPRLCVFGHIHEQGSQIINSRSGDILVNASYVDERYQPVNKPVRIEI